MSKHDLIYHIREHNPSAAAEFLNAFDEPALERYLTHLQFTTRPRSGDLWVRNAETPAVVTRGRHKHVVHA
ncbi:MAG: hypothetical protein GC159_13830 [Phycisphaera sp.]|nr:hypothetical protein [Phycisphaera sp.]